MSAQLHDTHVQALIRNSANGFAREPLGKGFKALALHEFTDQNGCALYWRIRLKHPMTGEKWIRPMCRISGQFKLGEPKFAGGKPLYALHRVAQNHDAAIWVVEGEQKADALNGLGLTATTSGGATSADACDWQPLAGRTVRLWRDFDDAGKTYEVDVAKILSGLGCSVLCVDVDKLGLGVGEDVIEWLAAHPDATASDIDGLPTITPSRHEKNATPALVVVGLHDFLSRELPPREEILSPWLLTQSLSMIYSWRGVGKTHVALGIAYAIASGSSFLGWKATTARKVLYIDGEMPGSALQARLAAIVAASDVQPDPGMLNIITPDLQTGAMPDLAMKEGQDVINGVIGDARVIIMDNLSCLARGGGRENEAESWLAVADWALAMRAQGRSVVFLHHSGKSGTQRGTSKREDLLDTVICLKRPCGYNPIDGAVFELHYEKARSLLGTDTDPIEAKLATNEEGLQAWTLKKVSSTNFDKVVALAKEGLTQPEISTELGINRSSVSRAVRKGIEEGKIVNIATRKGRNQHTKTWRDDD